MIRLSVNLIDTKKLRGSGCSNKPGGELYEVLSRLVRLGMSGQLEYCGTAKEKDIKTVVCALRDPNTHPILLSQEEKSKRNGLTNALVGPGR